MDRFDPFVKYADVYGDIINWEKDPMSKPQNQNKYFFSDGKTYYEQICKMLRLMSVFKEAFNQIYSNEDEISEAWENFVNNLSASVVEGSEPDVTLTWTDDSVNFEFTMVPGVPGEQGVGITSISFNSDYTMTITLSDGNSYTSMSLKGETGPQGPQGETGSGLQILDVYATLADLQSAHPTGQPGNAYQVGSGGSYTLYIWSSSQSAWVQAGTLGTVSPYTSAPLMDGTASAGSQNLYARGDHVHPSDTSRASKEELDALIKTSQALIDQSFTYRESPAIQDGLARIDKIKGNTLVFNQLAPTLASGNYNVNRSTIAYSNNVATVTTNGNDGFGFYRNMATVVGHTYLFTAKVKPSKVGYLRLALDEDSAVGNRIGFSSTAEKTVSRTWTCATANSPLVCYYYNNAIASGDNYTITNLMLIDLTLMGITADQFKSYFPLPYYSYQSTLLPFKGTGIKTVGKNLLPKMTSSAVSGIIWTVNEDGTVVANGTASADSQLTANFTLLEGNYYFNGCPDGGNDSSTWNCYMWDLTTGTRAKQWDKTSNVLNNTNSAQSRQFYSNGTDRYTYNCRVMRGQTVTNLVFKPMVRLSSADDVYEPYTSSTTNLPTLTYFPNGMKSAGNVYDELTPSKAITRVGSRAYQSGDESDTSVITDGTNTFYPLEIPTETDIDIDLNFKAYLNGTEQLLPVNGSVPSTSPIIADMTYLSIDDAMEYIIDKLANVPLNTQQILDALEDDVADLQTDVGALQPAVSALQTSVGNINTNIGQLSSTVAGHTASISDMQSDISDLNTGLSNLEDTVTNNTSKIGTLETGLSTTNGNVQSLSSQVQSIDGRVTNLETDLLIVVKKEYDFDSVAGNGNFGVQTPLSHEPGYKIIGIVGSEVQQGEYTSAEPWIIVTQAHVYYNSTGGVVLSMEARNVSEYTKTNVRVYLYLLCIKDIQSQ